MRSSQAPSPESLALGASEVVELARVMGWHPKKLILFGVEEEGVSLGDGLSARVETALRELVGLLRDELNAAHASPMS